jgi:hypothetical protein
MSIKDFVFRNNNRRDPSVAPSVLEELRRFLELNYIPEDVAAEASVELCESVLEGDFEEDFDEDLYEGSVVADALPDFESELFESEKSIFMTESAPDVGSSMPSRTPYSAPKASGAKPFSAPERGRSSAYSESPMAGEPQGDLQNMLSGIGLTFQQELLRQIDKRGYTDSQVYRKAGLDRKLFSKIRCNENYKPSKMTALALAVALELNLDETVDLLSRAGLALSPSSYADLIIKYCIMNGIYDIYQVNSMLYEYDQQLLGC